VADVGPHSGAAKKSGDKTWKKTYYFRMKTYPIWKEGRGGGVPETLIKKIDPGYFLNFRCPLGFVSHYKMRKFLSKSVLEYASERRSDRRESI